jgi:hypothetical protein
MKHLQYRNAGVLLAGVMSVGAVQAQAVKGQEAATSEAPIPAVTDWSSRSVIHRKPMTPDEFEAAGRSAEMAQRYRDPRYVASLMRRIESEAPRAATLQRNGLATAMKAAAAPDRRRGHGNGDGDYDPNDYGSGGAIRDWSNVLGGGTSGLGGSGLPGVYPAKYTFDIAAAPSCANDFVAYTTNAAGAQSSGTLETLVSTFTARPADGGTITIGVAGTPRSVTLTARTTPTTNLEFARGPNVAAGVEAATNATNLAAAVNLWSAQTGIRATSNAGNVTFSRTTGGNSATIPITDNLSNYTVGAAANGTGAPGQPTIVAFNQLYQGVGACNGAWNANGAVKAPNVLFAYNTGNGFITETSPVLSYYDDGKQVAFLQRSGNSLELVLLKWQAGQGVPGAPVAPTAVTAAAYQAARSGSATAMTKFSLGGTMNLDSAITFSAPYVDYSNDTLWVGDGNGRLHKFTGVFQGTPTQVTTGGFPATVEAGLKLSSPVANNGQVYIGSEAGTGTVGGKLYRVNAATGVVNATSGKLTRDNTPGVRASPIIDGSTGQIYTFVYNDNTSAYTDVARCNAFVGEIDGCRAVIQFTEFFPNGGLGDRRFIGRGNGVTRVLYSGGFDDAFYSSSNATGSMYIVGGRPDNTFYATLWRIPIVNGVLGTPVQGDEFGDRDRYEEGAGANNGTDNNQQISPTTVIKNGTNEYIFVSTASYANAAGCGAGTFANSACVYMYNLADLNGSAAGTGAAWGTGNAPSAALAAPGGTGGITVDNTSVTTGASQIYFSQLQSGGNAIQASQSGLQ